MSNKKPSQCPNLPPGLDKFDIVLDSPGSVYFADQEVTGHILIVLSQDTRISEILLELKGGAKSYWTKHSGTSRQHFADAEPYFLHQHNTGYTHSYGEVAERNLPKGRVSGESEAFEGVHEIPFSYQLPKTLPSSFEGEFGQVRYTGKAILERPWDFDIVTKTAFSVIGIEDMNSDTKAREPLRLERSDFDIRYCCRRSGSLSLCLALPKTGFAAGETIPLAAEIKNESSKSMRYAVARIKQHTTYRAKSAQGQERTKEVSRVIVSKEKGPIGPRASQVASAEVHCQ